MATQATIRVLVVGGLATAGLLVACGDDSRSQTDATGPPVTAEPPTATPLTLPGSEGCTQVLLGYDLSGARTVDALETRWTTRLPIGGSLEEYEYPTAGLAVDGSTAFVGLSDGTLHSIDVGTGEERWSIDVSSDAAAVDPSYGTADGRFRLAPVVDDGIVYLGANTGVVRAIDADTGRTNWSVGTGAATGVPVVVGDLLVVGVEPESITDGPAYIGPGSDGLGYSPSTTPATLRALAIGDGSEAWQTDMPYLGALPVLSGDTLVVASGGTGTNGVVVGLDPNTGAERWRTEVGPEPGLPVAAGGSVFVLSEDLLVALDPSTGQERWRTTEPGGEPIQLAATDTVVVAEALNDPYWLYAFDGATGDCLWRTAESYEGSFFVQTVGASLFVQDLNCGPIQVDPKTGGPLAWIHPNASPGVEANWEEYCWSYPDMVIAAAGDVLIAAGSIGVIGVVPLTG